MADDKTGTIVDATPVETADGSPASSSGTSKGAHLERYRWKPGQTGNRTGKARVPSDVRDLARSYTESALKRLAALAGLSSEKNDDGSARTVKPSGTPSVQLGATIAILDRAWGRPEQSVHLSTTEGPFASVAEGDQAAAMAEWAAVALERLAARRAAVVEAEALPESTETPTAQADPEKP